ncbi:MAG: formate dehydrogenase accessory protein FdhE [Chloroflexi bacterium]|nr:formate dehydrogenase accessory protein FdhE [Chloroflexota bacterium]
MSADTITDKDRELAQKCIECGLCKRARVKQKGLAYWVVKNIEDAICPACQAYAKVYGRKAHEPVP